FIDLRDRLRGTNVPCVYVDGRPKRDEPDFLEVSVMTAMLAQLRKATRELIQPRVIVLPHLDVLAADASGLTPEAREVVPLLYDEPGFVWLGFRDPSLPLLPVVEKRFERRLTVARNTRSELAAREAALRDAQGATA